MNSASGLLVYILTGGRGGGGVKATKSINALPIYVLFKTFVKLKRPPQT
jgi:hypothetical protein